MEECKATTNKIVLQLQFTVPLLCPQHVSDRCLETPEEPESFVTFVSMHVAVPAYLAAHQNTSLTSQPLLQQAMSELCLFLNFQITLKNKINKQKLHYFLFAGSE